MRLLDAWYALGTFNAYFPTYSPAHRCIEVEHLYYMDDSLDLVSMVMPHMYHRSVHWFVSLQTPKFEQQVIWAHMEQVLVIACQRGLDARYWHCRDIKVRSKNSCSMIWIIGRGMLAQFLNQLHAWILCSLTDANLCRKTWKGSIQAGRRKINLCDNTSHYLSRSTRNYCQRFEQDDERKV